MLSYEGIFFDEDTIKLIHSLETKKLDRMNDEIHCTFKYHPSEEQIFNDIVGKSFELYIIGYGNDGMNSGFQISLPNELIPYYINYDEENPEVLKIPHITTSLSPDAVPSNTKKLKFKALDKPIKITGRFGFWIKEKNNNYVSFKPYTKRKQNSFSKQII